MKIAGASKAEARLGAGGDVLPGVVDEDHGEIKAALKITKIGKELRHLGGVVLIRRVQFHQRIFVRRKSCTLPVGLTLDGISTRQSRTIPRSAC